MAGSENQDQVLDGVAIIGMAGRFPKAPDVATFWKNQLEGVEAITQFRSEELELGDPSQRATTDSYVLARSVLEDTDLFDAEFFGFYPREAELMDPQHRLFLEVCWEALEDAGYDPFSYKGAIGVYAGCSMETYFLSRLCSDPSFIRKFLAGYQVANYAELVGNSRDFLATKVSYKLNLRGPSFTMQAGCSTSLLAVTQACQSLLTYQCDMALAGGSSITFPQKRSSPYQEGGMVSPDGHCRTFDAAAQGTVFGGAVATVLLKRLEDARQDGDQIYAVIRGFAVNNDGSARVGYTAPSVEGQSRVIALAHAAADVNPESIGYVEAHGTATPLGDPIELAALTQAFRAHTTKMNFCTIGTAKTNVGHLDIAAGVTGLIHATHVVRDGIFPPTLHYHKPNPNFDFANSPFRVNTERSSWSAIGMPRRAGVSAFGVGGTNAHVIIEQAPNRAHVHALKPAHLLTLSARSDAALDRACDNLATFLSDRSTIDLANAAWTLQIGRKAFDCRTTIVASDVNEAVSALREKASARRPRSRRQENAAVDFLFPGQGAQRVNMAREIYDAEPAFREDVDRCAEILHPHLGADLRKFIYPNKGDLAKATEQLTDTAIAQPAIFVIELALARLLLSWGIKPRAMLGHSVGEFVAACLAGVFSLEDALALVATRGKLMHEIPNGGMLSVRLPEPDLRGRLDDQLDIAAINSPSLCVVAGDFNALKNLQNELEGEGIICRALVTSHAFHSAMMDPVIEPFTAAVAKLQRSAPKIPYLSGVTGTWITAEQAVDPTYWGRHLRQAVQFSPAISLLRSAPTAVLLEVGPGNVLGTLARQHVAASDDQIVSSTLADQSAGKGDFASLLAALGSMWRTGVEPNWAAVHRGERLQRISLPTYPFERKRYWLKDTSATAVIAATPPEITKEFDEPVTAINASSKEDAVSVNVKDAAVAEAAPDTGARLARIRAALVEIFEELSGLDLSKADGSASFLEMGFDSLFLTQVTQALKEKLDVKITFRQLLGNESTLNALVQFVDGKMPAESFAAPAPIQTVVPEASQAAVTSSAPSASVPPVAAPVGGIGEMANFASAAERVMREQLQTMNLIFAKQLEVMRAAPSSAAAEVGAGPGPVAGPSLLSGHSSATVAVAKPTAPSVEAARSGKEEFKSFGPYKPPQKSMSGDLNARQRAALQIFIDRHTKRTLKSKTATQNDRKYLADPRVVSGFRPQWKELVYPLVVDRSKGSRFWDLDGNEYIDIVNGFGPIMLGHRPDFLESAIEKQLHEGIETGPSTPLAGEVAKMFCEMTGNERMSFCNTGSEAVMAAIRVARTVTGRSKVVFFAGDYHGMFDEVLVKGVTNKSGAVQAVPVAPGIPRDNVSNMIVLEYGSPDSLAWIRQNAKDLAAVLVEPVQSRHPNLQPIAFLKELREITAASETALIFDEVVTGFRVHPGGCQALFGIRADLATYGKVLGGGMPIGIVAGTSRFMDALDGGMWQYGDDSYPEVGVTFFAGTFVRHPLTVAAVKAVLQHFKEQGPELQARLTKRTAQLVRTLNEFLEQANVPLRIETFGSIFYFGFPIEERFGSLFYYFMRDKGIHVREGFPCFLTTAHSDEDIEKIIAAFKQSALEMMAAGFFSTSPSDSQASVADTPSIVADLSESVTEVALTEPQREIFLAAKLDDDVSCSFNESFSLSMRGALQIPALSEALNAVVSRHEALRATVAADGSSLNFAPQLELQLPVHDLAELDDAAREGELQRILADDAKKAFDLTSGPLVRTQLVRLGADNHVLIFTSHHIVCDGWSTNVLLSDLAELYSAKVQGRHPELKLPVSFSQYARTEQAERGSEARQKIEAYWLAKFKDMPAPLDLPLDRPRSQVRSYAGATYRTQIAAEAYRKIKQLGAKKGCTLFATLLAGYQALLHRLSNQNDIVVGIPTAGQSLLDDGNLVGHCVNFLPLRSQFHDGMPFAELLNGVKQTLLDAYDHQSYTYGTLVRKLNIPRDPARLPLMEVQFNLERIGAGTVFRDLQTRVDPNPKAAVNFDMFFNIVESDQGLTIDCDYNTDLFDGETISRWCKHYETLLLDAAADADKSVEDLALMMPAEVTALIAKSNPKHVGSFGTGSIHRIFETQASQTPDAVAAVIGTDQISYRELNERANRLARALQKSGVKRGSIVALCTERSLEMIVAFLGILKSGGVYLPLDSSYPAEHLAMIFEDARPSALVTQKALLGNLPKVDVPIICIETGKSAMDAESQQDLDGTVDPTDAAYIIYTSGSTGRPKGVVVTHQNVVRLLKATEDWFHFDHNDVWTLFHSYAFDFSVWETWGCLLTGGKLVVVPYWVTRSPQDFYNLLVQEKVTVLNQTPAAFYQLVQVEESGVAKSLSLRRVIFGGEALNFANLGPWFARHGNLTPQLINMYGITETTVHVTYRPLVAADATEQRSLIGTPIPDLRIYLLDSKRRPVPPGVVGELYIGGAGVARGYLNRPDLTGERFLPDPFTAEAGSRMYKSGDLGRLLNNGDIEYLGRSDSQVKVHGYRIELGEIEAALAQHHGVQQTVVVARKDGPGAAKLVAYIVGKSGTNLTPTELREYLEKKLPAHMIPFAYVTMEAIPLTVNGKVDKARLPAPEVGAGSPTRVYVAPRTSQEKIMANIFAEVLGIEQVGVTDNLFELGADSLHVFQITSRAGQAGLSVTPKMVLQQRTIVRILSGMSTVAAAGSVSSTAAKPSSITRVDRQKYRVTR